MHRILLPSSRVTRIINSYRHPVQASLAARLPALGERVPFRAYWRARPLPALGERVPFRAYWRARSLPALAPAALVARLRARREIPRSRWQRAKDAARRLDRRTIPAVAGGIAVGAVAMYYLDRGQGRRRRAMVRDRFAHIGHVFTHDVQRIERRGRFLRGVARGVRHDAAALVHVNGRQERVDDETLVARVRSEVLRSGHWKAGEINIDAYEGRVTVRGQMESESDILRLVEETRRVEGVMQVRSYLHLPGTLPPNKAESLESERVPAYLHTS